MLLLPLWQPITELVIKYSEAKIQFQKYAELKKDVPENIKRLWYLSCDSALQWMKNPVEVTVTNEQKLNSKQSDWGTSIYKNDIVFVSDGNAGENKTEVNKKEFLKNIELLTFDEYQDIVDSQD